MDLKPFLKLTPVVLDIETTGLDSLQHEIVAIGIKFGRKEHYEVIIVQETIDEEGLISAFLMAIREFQEKGVLVGYNISRFDIPFIHARASKYGFGTSILRQFMRIDLMHVVQRYILTNRRSISLADICDYYGIERDSEFSGALVPEFWQRKEYDKIYAHLQRDLRSEWALFERLQDLCAHNLKVRYGLQYEVVWDV